MKKFQLCEKCTKTDIAQLKVVNGDLNGVTIEIRCGEIDIIQWENEENAFDRAANCICEFLDGLAVGYRFRNDSGKDIVIKLNDEFCIDSDGLIFGYEYEYTIEEVEE